MTDQPQTLYDVVLKLSVVLTLCLTTDKIITVQRMVVTLCMAFKVVRSLIRSCYTASRLVI